MGSLLFRSALETGQDWLDVGIRDLQTLTLNGEVVVYATSGPSGGLAGWQLQEGRQATLTDTQAFNSLDDGICGNLFCLDDDLAIGGSGGIGVRGYALDSAGDIGAAQSWGRSAGRRE